MTNLEGLERSTIEARIEYLINQRTEQFGENRQFAEIQVTRTAEGRALWNRARKLRMAESADSPSCSRFNYPAASLIGIEARYENLVALRMSEHSEPREVAENVVIHTAAGLELWERMRALRLAE
jgi:hypothetical protein